MVQSSTAGCAFQSPNSSSQQYSAVAIISLVDERGPIPRRGTLSSRLPLTAVPDRFRTTDVRASALTACLQRTHVEALEGPLRTAKDLRRRNKTARHEQIEWKDRRHHGWRYRIGLAAAKRFIEEGAFVFIFGRRQEALDAAVAELGPNARAVKGSVSDEADLDRLYAALKAERGTLDIVFANAGAGSPLPLGQITAAHIDETFDTM